MFVVNDDLSIYATRGDAIFFRVTAKDHGTPYIFKPGDIVRMSVTAKKDVGSVYLQKDFPVNESTKSVFIYLEEKDTNFGKKMNKHEDFWYEIVLNPDSVPQTIIGYDDDGPKIFRVYPDAEEIDPALPEPEEIPVVDAELDLTSHRPVSNHAVAVAIARLTAAIEELKGITPVVEEVEGSVFNAIGQVESLSIVAIDAYGVAVKNGFEGTVEEWLASLKGEKGESGKDGVPAEHSWDGTVLTITSASGTSSADLKGEKGEPGKDGVVKFSELTEAEKAEIAEMVAGQVEVPDSGGNVDLSGYAQKSELPIKVSQLENDSGYITGYTETDPTVPSWAKQPNKPTYTAAEVGALPANTFIPSVGDLESYVDNKITYKQDAITGTAGQFVVIGSDGNPTTKTILIAEEATF